jgi:hypothetical protein
MHFHFAVATIFLWCAVVVQAGNGPSCQSQAQSSSARAISVLSVPNYEGEKGCPLLGETGVCCFSCNTPTYGTSTKTKKNICTCANPLASFRYSPSSNFNLDDSDRMMCTMSPVVTFNANGNSDTPNAWASTVNAIETCRKQQCTCVDPSQILQAGNVYPFDSDESVSPPSGPFELKQSIDDLRQFFMLQIQPFLIANRALPLVLKSRQTFRGLVYPYGRKKFKAAARQRFCTPLDQYRSLGLDAKYPYICPTSGSSGTPPKETSAPTTTTTKAPTTTTAAPTAAPTCVADWQAYLAKYQDVKAAGMNAGLHYKNYGYNEGRDLCVVCGTVKKCGGFDEAAYLQLNPDVAKVYGTAVGRGIAHYKDYGYNEPGRLVAVSSPCVADWSGYLDRYQDVKAAGMNAGLHYKNYGYNEGRDLCVVCANVKKCGGWDDARYLQLNPDVAKVYGTAVGRGIAHYKDYGYNEPGRLVAVGAPGSSTTTTTTTTTTTKAPTTTQAPTTTTTTSAPVAISIAFVRSVGQSKQARPNTLARLLSTYMIGHPERSAANILYNAYLALVDYQTKLSYIPGAYDAFDPRDSDISQLHAHFCTYTYSVRYGVVRATVREWARLFINKNRDANQEKLLTLLTVIAGEVLRLQAVNARHIGELQENNDFVSNVGWSYDRYTVPDPIFLSQVCNNGGIAGITKWLLPYTSTPADSWKYD